MRFIVALCQYRLQYRASKLSPAHRVGSEVVLPLSVLEALLLTSLHNHTSLVQPSTGPGDMASAQDGHLMHSVQRTLDFNEDKFPVRSTFTTATSRLIPCY